VGVNATMVARKGTLTIAGQTFTVTQAGDMSFIPLTNGDPLHDSLEAEAPQGAWKYYYVDVPSGAAARLTVDLDALDGDADLYVRFGALPTLKGYDCRPDLRATTGERCTFESPAAGRWWIGVTNHDAGSIAYILQARYAVNFVLPAPTGLSPGGPSQDTAAVVSVSPIVLSWDPVLGASRYEVLVYSWDVRTRTWAQMPTASATRSEVTYGLPIENTYYAWAVRGFAADTVSPLASFAFIYYRPAACRFAISPTSASFNSHGGSGTVSVTAAAECSWTANSDVGWISIGSGDTGTGTASVAYRVAGNPNPEPRTGTLTIAARTFTVTQRGRHKGKKP